MLLLILFFFFFNDTATTEIYTLSLHDALPIWFQNYHRSNVNLQSSSDSEFFTHKFLFLVKKVDQDQLISIMCLDFRLGLIRGKNN